MVDTFPLLFDQLTFQVLLEIFGSPLLLGIFTLLFLYTFGLIMRLSFEMLTLMLFIGVMTLIAIFIPELVLIITTITGIFLGLFLFYKILGR